MISASPSPVKPSPTRRFAVRFLGLLRQRPDGGVEHVVEHAHRGAHDFAERLEVECAPSSVNGFATNGVRLMLPRQQQP